MSDQHDSIDILITLSTCGHSGNMAINSRHTCPTISTTWWPAEIGRAIKNELRSKSVDKVTMVEVEYVS